MDISSFIFAILCCLMPYCAIIGLVAVLGTRAKYKSAISTLERIEQNQRKPFDQARLRRFSKIIVLIACVLFVLFLSIFLGLVMAFYADPSSMTKVDADVLWLIIPFLMIVGVLTSGLLILIFAWMFRKQRSA